MARRSTARRVEEFVLFDVLYEDGTRTSNRKVPGSELVDIEVSCLRGRSRAPLTWYGAPACRALLSTPGSKPCVPSLAIRPHDSKLLAAFGSYSGNRIAGHFHKCLA
jgi:hypothetical protein